jgi:hypothetical protein
MKSVFLRDATELANADDKVRFVLPETEGAIVATREMEREAAENMMIFNNQSLWRII